MAAVMDPKPRPALTLVRHGRPLVPAGVCYGVTDVAADAAHTQAIAQDLAAHILPGAILMSSPLQRCSALARAVHQLRPDLELCFEPRLAEFDFGCWEGWRWDAIPKSALDAWTARFASHRFGGIDCVQDMLERVGAVWDACRLAGKSQVWITHAGVMSAASLLAREIRVIDQAHAWPSPSPAHGARVVLQMGD
jgi:alpha-ribazole phosphatase